MVIYVSYALPLNSASLAVLMRALLLCVLTLQLRPQKQIALN